AWVTHFNCRVSASAASTAGAADSARAPAINPVMILFICRSLFPLRPSTTDGRMPEGDAPFDEGDHPVEGGPRDRRNGDLRPDQVDGETPHPGRYPEAHSHHGRPEEFRYDCADQGQSRVDLEGVEYEGARSGEP